MVSNLFRSFNSDILLPDKSEGKRSVSATFVVYVDESGDEGFSFGKGSSDWFVLSAVITRKATEIETVKLVDSVRDLLNKPKKKPLHFRDLRHEQRLPLIAEIARADLRTVSVFFFKPLIKEPDKFRERFRLYFYAVRFLLERVSWYCRDNINAHDAGNCSAEIVFSNRSGMSYTEISEYLSYLKSRTDDLGVNIHWPTINPKHITAFSPGKRLGLQIADAVASGFFSAVQPSRYGYTEDHYARLLKPIVYNRKGLFQSYGLKFWPAASYNLLINQETKGWLTEYEGPGTQDPTR